MAQLMVQPERYLEIGVWYGGTFEAVKIPQRVAVDPQPRFSRAALPRGITVRAQTSDDFFREESPSEKFDIVFLDGLHTYEQTYRDLINSLGCTHAGSVLLMDDVVPSDRMSALRDVEECYAERERVGSPDRRWHGDVFRVILIVRDHHPELKYRTIVQDADNEQAVIWMDPYLPVVRPIPDDVLTSYRQYSYDEIFRDGIPEYFHPGSEDAVMREIEDWLRR